MAESLMNFSEKEETEKSFFDDIMDVVTMLGGELNDAF